jgi:hypothetical protein
MRAIELFRQDGSEIGVYYCSECRTTHRDKAVADACCAPRLCACGKPTSKYQPTCEACWNRKLRDREGERFMKAAHLATWDGPLYREWYGNRDGYFESVDEFMEWMDENPTESAPAYLWTCDKVPIVNLEVNCILASETEEAYEDFDYTDLTGIDELRAAMEKFNALNTDVVNWEPNYTRAFIVGEKA